MTAVVREFIRHHSEVLCARRRDDTASDSGHLEVISGNVRSDTEDPSEDAWRVLSTTNPDRDFEFVRRGTPLSVSDGIDKWTVYPFLFSAETRDMRVRLPSTETEWLSPTALHTRDTVRGLWESYRRVAPDVDVTRTDETTAPRGCPSERWDVA